MTQVSDRARRRETSWCVATSPNLLFINKPVKSVADLKNLKIRNAGSVGGYWLGQMGAIPQTMSAPK